MKTCPVILHVIKNVDEILKKNEDVFDVIGCLEDTYQIKIDPNRMEKLGVICKAEEPTEWVSLLVVVRNQMIKCDCV